MLHSIEDLRNLTDQDYKDLGFPIGLRNKIKQRIEREVTFSAQNLKD